MEGRSRCVGVNRPAIGPEPALISLQRKWLATDAATLSKSAAAIRGADLHPRQIFKENGNGPCLLNTGTGGRAALVGPFRSMPLIPIKRAAEKDSMKGRTWLPSVRGAVTKVTWQRGQRCTVAARPSCPNMVPFWLQKHPCQNAKVTERTQDSL